MDGEVEPLPLGVGVDAQPNHQVDHFQQNQRYAMP